MKDGNIMCYDPVSGDVSIVLDVDAETMSVYEDGIYYKIIKDIIKRDDGLDVIDKGLYYYSFKTKTIEEITDIYPDEGI